MRRKTISIAILFCIILLILCICFADPVYLWSGSLCEAIRADDTAAALQLIEKGVQKGYRMDTLNVPPSVFWTLLESSPRTPLQLACEKGNYAVAKRLLDEGASARPVEGGITREPIFCVLLRQYSEDDYKLIQALIDHGAVFYDPQCGDELLVRAASRVPRKSHAQKNPETGSYFESAYSEEVAKGITDVFMLLSDYGDCYATDGGKRNALHWAVILENWYLVETLVSQFDYDLAAKEFEGKTPADLAIEAGAPDYIIELLKTEW